jgi:hypothetical protein
MFRKTSTDTITVSPRVQRRARQVSPGTEVTWIEGTMAQVGSAVVHHRPGDEMLDEAIMGAEAVLALLHEMRRREG